MCLIRKDILTVPGFFIQQQIIGGSIDLKKVNIKVRSTKCVIVLMTCSEFETNHSQNSNLKSLQGLRNGFQVMGGQLENRGLKFFKKVKIDRCPSTT